MGYFQINNSTLTIPDPQHQYDDLDFQGYQGNTAVYGEYETGSLLWVGLTDSQVAELHQRIENLNGQRVPCTIKARNSGGWRTVYVSLHYPRYTHIRELGHGVSVRMERISSIPS